MTLQEERDLMDEAIADVLAYKLSPMAGIFVIHSILHPGEITEADIAWAQKLLFHRRDK